MKGRTFLGFSRYSKRVASSQCTPLLTFAAVYEKPSTFPLIRPNSLCGKKRKDGNEKRGVGRLNERTRASWDRPYWARQRPRYDIGRNGF